MPEETRLYWGRQVKFVSDSAEVFNELLATLPPSPFPQDPSGNCDTTFSILRQQRIAGLYQDSELLLEGLEARPLIDALESRFQMDLACNAPGAAFVHAGVVELEGKCLVLPGASWAGKSTLVQELLRQGAGYFSDEFAVIDPAGMIHPYRRPLALRVMGESVRVPPPSATIDQGRMTLVAITIYKQGARWSPSPLSKSDGVLALFKNTVSARLSPQRDLNYLTTAAARATFVESARGEATEVARSLLTTLETLT